MRKRLDTSAKGKRDGCRGALLTRQLTTPRVTHTRPLSVLSLMLFGAFNFSFLPSRPVIVLRYTVYERAVVFKVIFFFSPYTINLLIAYDENTFIIVHLWIVYDPDDTGLLKSTLFCVRVYFCFFLHHKLHFCFLLFSFHGVYEFFVEDATSCFPFFVAIFVATKIKGGVWCCSFLNMHIKHLSSRVTKRRKTSRSSCLNFFSMIMIIFFLGKPSGLCLYSPVPLSIF